MNPVGSRMQCRVQKMLSQGHWDVWQNIWSTRFLKLEISSYLLFSARTNGMSTAADLQNDLQQATKQSEIDFMRVARGPDVLGSLSSSICIYHRITELIGPLLGPCAFNKWECIHPEKGSDERYVYCLLHCVAWPVWRDAQASTG